MSGSREYIRNGQPHFITPQTVVNFRRKNTKRTFSLISIVLVVVTCCIASFGCLYYLNIRFTTDIQAYNEKINREMQLLTERLNVKLFEYERQIERFRARIEELQKKDDKKQSTDTQSLLQESESNKFKGVAVENVEEFPDIEDIDQEDLINVGKENRHKGTFEQPASRKHLDEVPFDKFHSPDRLLKKNKTSSLLEERIREDIQENKRHRRDAEFSHSSGINIFETSSENERITDTDNRNKLPNQTEHYVSKSSPSPNQTGVEKKSTCCPCDETTLRKAANLQKNNGKRSSQVKKSLNQQEQTYGELDENTDIVEVQKTVIAAHFGADSSRYNVRTHHYYEGNGHLRHPTGEYEDWRASAWFDELNMHRHFVLLKNGNIKVHSAGLYFVYAQIFYSDLSDVNGYAIYLNSQIVLQCITSTFTSNNVTTKSNTCFTGGVIKCNAGDTISVKTMDVNRKVILESTRSFLGMFKIGEFQTIK